MEVFCSEQEAAEHLLAVVGEVTAQAFEPAFARVGDAQPVSPGPRRRGEAERHKSEERFFPTPRMIRDEDGFGMQTSRRIRDEDGFGVSGSEEFGLSDRPGAALTGSGRWTQHSGLKPTATNEPGPFPDSCYSFAMEIILKIPDEIAARAKARGMRVEAYIEEILAQQVGAQPSEARGPRTPQEIRSWLDSLAQFSEKIPPLPETISREWIYQEHN